MFGTPLPSVVKATAIVNGEVITQTDIDQRLALLAIANGRPIPAEELERLRQQVLRNLIDETLQIQAAKAEEIDDQADADIDKTVARVAGNVKQTPEQMADYLKAQRLLDPLDPPPDRGRDRLAPAAERQDRKRRQRRRRRGQGGHRQAERVQGHRGISRRRNLPVGQPGQSSRRCWPTPTRSSQRCSRARSFVGYARQYSEASTAAVGGDLGWVRPEQLPEPLADGGAPDAARARCQQPIAVPGGYSIVAVQDTRKVLTADPRDAVLSLKQVSISFPDGHHRASRPSRSSPASPRPRRTSAAAAAPRSSPPSSTARSSSPTRSSCATCRPRFRK